MPQRALDPGEASVLVSVRVPKATKGAYQAAAKQTGETLSDWLRRTLDHAASVPSIARQRALEQTRHVHQPLEGGTGVPVCRCGAIQLDDKRWT